MPEPLKKKIHQQRILLAELLRAPAVIEFDNLTGTQ